MTLRELLVEKGSLAKMSQLGWLETPNKEMPSEFIKLGIVLSVVYDDFWMNIILKFWLTSRTVLMRKLFFQMFYEKTFSSFKIIL